MGFDEELRDRAAAAWSAQLMHPFVRGIGDGTLPRERFEHFITQDYLYLIDYGRLLALATARAPDLATMQRFAALTQAILVTEMDLHRAFSAEWGVDAAALTSAQPTRATRGYVDFLLRTASLGDFAELVAALLPCIWSYAEIGELLAVRRAARQADPGPYGPWVDLYAGEQFRELSDWCRSLVRELGDDAAPATRERMHRAFEAAVEHELEFWQSSWRLAPPDG